MKLRISLEPMAARLKLQSQPWTQSNRVSAIIQRKATHAPGRAVYHVAFSNIEASNLPKARVALDACEDGRDHDGFSSQSREAEHFPKREVDEVEQQLKRRPLLSFRHPPLFYEPHYTLLLLFVLRLFSRSDH